MENNNFDLIIRGIPEFCEKVVPLAKRCGVNSLEALSLIILAEYPELVSFYSSLLEDSFVKLTQKGCVLADGEKFTLTSKGAIVAKSVSAAKNS